MKGFADLFDLQHPFYRPLWIRVAIVAVCLAWMIFELTNGAIGWAALSGALGLWSAWQFFVVWSLEDEDKDTK